MELFTYLTKEEFKLDVFSNIETIEEIYKYLDNVNLSSVDYLNQIINCKNKTNFVERILIHLIKKNIKFYSIVYGEIDICDANYNDNIKQIQTCDLLNYACFCGYVEVVKLLIDKNVNLEVEANRGCNERPIHFACERGNIEIVKLLIDKNVNLEVEDDYKQRPIHFACRRDSFEIVKLLVDKNVNLDVEDEYEQRPIYFACTGGHYYVVDYLLKKGIELDYETNNKIFSMICYYGYVSVVKLVIEKGVDLEFEFENKYLWPKKMKPIHIVCRSNNSKFMEHISGTKKYGCVARTNINETNDNQLNIKHTYILKLLIDAGINLETENENGCRAIHFVCGEGHIAMCEMLIKEGVNLEAEDIDNLRPIHYACDENHLQIVELLIEAGVNLEVEDKDGNKPLHIACKKGYTQMVKLLIKAGVNLDAEDKNGNKPIFFATYYNHKEIVEILIKAGANYTYIDLNTTMLFMGTKIHKISSTLVNFITDNEVLAYDTTSKKHL